MAPSAEELALKRRIDELYTAYPFYGSRLLQSFEREVQSVAGIKNAQGAISHLENSVSGELAPRDALRRLRTEIGVKALEADKAAALLVANALSRPDQFREISDGLEDLKPGLGRQAAKLLAQASGNGDRRILAALRAAGARTPHGTPLTYDAQGRFDSFFDGSYADGRDSYEPASAVDVPPEYTGYGPGGKPRRSGLLPAPKQK